MKELMSLMGERKEPRPFRRDEVLPEVIIDNGTVRTVYIHTVRPSSIEGERQASASIAAHLQAAIHGLAPSK